MMIGASDALPAFSLLPDLGKSGAPLLAGNQVVPQAATPQGADATLSALILALLCQWQNPSVEAPSLEKKLKGPITAAGAALAPTGALPVTGDNMAQAIEAGSVSASSASAQNPLAQFAAIPKGTSLDSAVIPTNGKLAFAAPNSLAAPLPTVSTDGPPPVAVNPAPSLPETEGKVSVDPNSKDGPGLSTGALPDRFGTTLTAEDAGNPKRGNETTLERMADATRLDPPGIASQARDLGAVTQSEPAIPRQPSHVGLSSLAILGQGTSQPKDPDEAGQSRAHEGNPTAETGLIANLSDAAANRHIEAVKPTSSLTDQVHAQVTAHLDQLRESGRVEVQMNLHPPELGRVQLHLAVDDGHLSVRFLVQNDGAKNALVQQMEPMRVRFAELGLSLGQFDVRRDGTSAHWQAPADSGGADQVPPLGKPDVAAAPSGYVPLTNSSAMVDVMA